MEKSITDISAYDRASGFSSNRETFRRLGDARLVFVDSARLLAEFSDTLEEPQTEMRLDRIDQLLLKAGAVVSEPHCMDNEVHRPPRVLEEALYGFRPMHYGRSALFEIGAADRCGLRGLLDIKGCGVAADVRPHPHTTRNGILFLHDAILELINATVLNRLFRRDGVALSTVPFFAIVQTGIRARPTWAKAELPCATLLRKALVRQPGHVELPARGSITEEIQLKVEHYLLTRGLTTTGPITTVSVVKEGETMVLRLDGLRVDAATENIVIPELRRHGLDPPQILQFANVQLARDASPDPLRACLVDLGHVRACDELSGHLGIFVRDRQLNWGRILKKGHDGWPWRLGAESVDQTVYGLRPVTDIDDFPALSAWLNPNETFKFMISGLLRESIRLAMLLDTGAIEPSELAGEIDAFTRKALPG